MHEKPADGGIRIQGLIYILIGLFFLSACSSQPASVISREQPPSRKIQEHRVSSGETLYSIAWRYDVDHRRLARLNGVPEPFTIYPGQTLRLDVENAPAVAKAAAPSTLTRSATASPPVSAAPSRPPARSKNQTSGRNAGAPPALLSEAPDWRWPAKGRVIRAFGTSTGLNQGIDIAGNLGDAVQAAAAGQVVYAGSGLRGYGNLVIIKHNDTYLSAYAHNRRLQVSEGDSVKAGASIAEMGSSGTDSVRLHFEIRRDGKPVDPIRYLPKR